MANISARTRIFAVVALVAALPTGTALAQSDIGAASSVVNQVSGERGGTSRQLAIGDRVYQSEVISTASDARGQILFRDETALTLGPSSRVALDRFVYNPGGQSAMSVSAAKGVFRFVSGNLPSTSYNVGTPVGTIGVRGTIVDGIYDDQLKVLIAQLLSGKFVFTGANGLQTWVTNIGDVLEVGLDGKITIYGKLSESRRAQLAAIRDLLDRSDLLDNPGRGTITKEVLRKSQTPSSPGGPGRPGGGGPGSGGDGG
jgi:hypothetical protein